MKERRMYKIPDDFSPIIYKNLNKKLMNMSDEELIEHYMTIGRIEKRHYRLSLYFNYSKYRELNENVSHLSDIELVLDYIKNGLKEKRRLY